LFFSLLDSYEEIIDQNYSRKKVVLWEKVLHEIERMHEYKPFAENWKDVHWTETVNTPLNEKCLFYVNASWMYNIWLKNDSVKVKNMIPAELPVLRPSHGYYGGYMMVWGVLKNSPHREQAIRLMLAINKPDVAEKWARYTKSPTGIKGKLSTASFGLDKFESFQHEIDRKYGRHKFPVFNNSNFCIGLGNEAIGNFDFEVMSGDVSAQSAINEIETGLKKKKLL
jgi:ABC-type glycerol-3-phosphate transport system substrate-binding protein